MTKLFVVIDTSLNIHSAHVDTWKYKKRSIKMVFGIILILI